MVCTVGLWRGFRRSWLLVCERAGKESGIEDLSSVCLLSQSLLIVLGDVSMGIEAGMYYSMCSAGGVTYLDLIKSDE